MSHLGLKFQEFSTKISAIPSSWILVNRVAKLPVFCASNVALDHVEGCVSGRYSGIVDGIKTEVRRI